MDCFGSVSSAVIPVNRYHRFSSADLHTSLHISSEKAIKRELIIRVLALQL